MTTQNNEFEEQIKHIGELYHSIKIGLKCAAWGAIIKSSELEKCYSDLAELCDIARMAVKHIHQPKEN